MSEGNICPVCKSVMKALIFSYYCSNDCDRLSTPKVAIDGIVVIEFRGVKWKMIKVNKGSELPDWVTRAWALINDVSDGRSDPTKNLPELAILWEAYGKRAALMTDVPGWSLGEHPERLDKFIEYPMLGFSRT